MREEARADRQSSRERGGALPQQEDCPQNPVVPPQDHRGQADVVLIPQGKIHRQRGQGQGDLRDPRLVQGLPVPLEFLPGDGLRQPGGGGVVVICQQKDRGRPAVGSRHLGSFLPVNPLLSQKGHRPPAARQIDLLHRPAGALVKGRHRGEGERGRGRLTLRPQKGNQADNKGQQEHPCYHPVNLVPAGVDLPGLPVVQPLPGLEGLPQPVVVQAAGQTGAKEPKDHGQESHKRPKPSLQNRQQRVCPHQHQGIQHAPDHTGEDGAVFPLLHRL